MALNNKSIDGFIVCLTVSITSVFPCLVTVLPLLRELGRRQQHRLREQLDQDLHRLMVRVLLLVLELVERRQEVLLASLNQFRPQIELGLRQPVREIPD
jgi:hypothetical protein